MTRPHRAVKVDANQAEIIADLERMGAYTWRLSDLGGEILDIMVFWYGMAIPVEIKAPGKIDDLTAGEREGIRKLELVGVEAIVATCTEDIVSAVFAELPFTDVDPLPLNYTCAYCGAIVETPPDLT